jgi:hypothetical protein
VSTTRNRGAHARRRTGLAHGQTWVGARQSSVCGDRHGQC